MKVISSMLFIVFFSTMNVFAQSFLSPESVCYDSINKTYIVSFAGTGMLGMQKDSLESFKVFASGLTSPKGMIIVDTILYVTDYSNVKGYSLNSREKLIEFPVPNAQFLNDITADDDGMLYVTDMNANKIIRIDPVQSTVETFLVTPNPKPNGLYWDTASKLLYIVYFTDQKLPIQSLDIKTKEVKDAYKAELKQLDGITKDSDGNYYVSSWATDSVYCFLGGFVKAPIAIQKKFTSPADIYYDKYNTRLVIPCMNINKIHYLDVILKDIRTINLISPAENEINVLTKPLFEWEAVEGINKYYLIVYKPGIFEYIDSTSETEYQMPLHLNNSTSYQWSVSGYKNDTIYESAPRTFTIMATDGVSQETEIPVSIYPNPAGDYIRIANLMPDRIYHITLSEIQGRVILSRTNIPGTGIDIPTDCYPNGTYYISLRTGCSLWTGRGLWTGNCKWVDSSLLTGSDKKTYMIVIDR